VAAPAGAAKSVVSFFILKGLVTGARQRRD
jgi:hypothetical protein